MISSSDASGSSITQQTPSIASTMLWGGIFVAMPTAIPVEPLISRFGSLDGKTVGSFRRSS